ncbi:hypothetical protein Sgly_2674 [Syntrophobotulus glycolicus DSM 8271]|uniref:Uncharacterized protein n=1 Tax=Syntrophobotulus glycolicus (strain DSM 8271 / FlGlyR) TaxID=645991 RepID=F0SX88_SYNGF|nr:hypothetical protein [Syntrophobotulus glycolicus]ADY56948.1 hypothetical protein Sgly_2674 [Syntrophobotulus glycolicus DSM 8271]
MNANETIDQVFNEIHQGKDFYIVLGNFLDEFYRQDSENQQKMIEEEPSNYDLPVYQKAFMAAAVHKLANDYNLNVPSWVFKKDYYSSEPYFDCNAKGNLKLLFMYISPAEFKHRNLFVDENILKRV